MNARIFRGCIATALLLASMPAIAQNFRFIWQGTAYYAAENKQIAERIVDVVVGANPASSAQVVFFRGKDRASGQLSLRGEHGSLAQLPSGSYCAVAVAPGSHTYNVDGQSLSLQVAPGNRRYVRIGDDNANPQITVSNAPAFLRMVTGKRGPLYASN